MFFKGKTAVIAGASHPVGLAVSRVLAEAGATVVAMDVTDSALVDLARSYPAQIEPLAMQLGNPSSARVFGAIWGREPVALLLNLVPLSALAEGGDLPDLSRDGVDHGPDRLAARMAMAVGTSVQLVRGLRGALAAGQGAVISVLPAPERRGAAGLPLRRGTMGPPEAEDPAMAAGRISGLDLLEEVGYLEAQAMEGAMLRLGEALAQALRGSGARAGSLVLQSGERIAPEVVVEAVLYLARAAGANGSVLRLAPEGTAQVGGGLSKPASDRAPAAPAAAAKPAAPTAGRAAKSAQGRAVKSAMGSGAKAAMGSGAITASEGADAVAADGAEPSNPLEALKRRHF